LIQKYWRPLPWKFLAADPEGKNKHNWLFTGLLSYYPGTSRNLATRPLSKYLLLWRDKFESIVIF